MMNMIELTEYKPLSIPRDHIPTAVINEIKQKYSSQIKVSLRDTNTGDKWQLICQGWVGYICLTDGFSIKLNPKVPLKNLFAMLAYAYNLKSFRFLDGLIDCESLEGFYDDLAAITASRILHRCHKGLYQTYLVKTGQLPSIRGRWEVRRAIEKPWHVQPICHYWEQTRDIEDNQILAWTLHCIRSTGILSKKVRMQVRKAERVLEGFVTRRPFTAHHCIGRQYNRLNEDYRALHALCRFFLDHSSPSHKTGNRPMVPFLVDMARLYESFVAQWLKTNLSHYCVRIQQREYLDQYKKIYFNIDLVLYETQGQTARYILDTKYKTADKPSTDDIAQIVAYAAAKKSLSAVLVYPQPLDPPLNILIDDYRVRSLTFSLDGDLQQAGEVFLQNLLSPAKCKEMLQ